MRLYKVSEVSKILQINKDRVYELIYSGQLKAIRLSRRGIRITEDALKEFLQEAERVK